MLTDKKLLKGNIDKEENTDRELLPPDTDEEELDFELLDRLADGRSRLNEEALWNAWKQII